MYALLTGAIGCADIAGVQNVANLPGPRLSETEPDPPTSWPVRISDSGVYVFTDGAINAFMTYDAYHASIGGFGYATDHRGSSSYTFAPREQHTFWAFQGNRFAQYFSVPTQYECGTDLRAEMAYRAWWQGVGVGGAFSLVEDSNVKSGSATQSPCPTFDTEEQRPAGGDTGGGGGGAGFPEKEEQTQYTETCMVRYTYDVETGEILYYVILYCN